jgi:hypothetical protein
LFNPTATLADAADNSDEEFLDVSNLSKADTNADVDVDTDADDDAVILFFKR